MPRRSFLLISLALCLAAAPAVASTVTTAKFTVIPVSLTNSLSSATSCVGDTFSATYNGAQCGAFPCGTRFTGTITRVVRAARNIPGQIDVKFTQATLPDCSCVPINGALAPLSCQFVSTDPCTGLMMLKPEVRKGSSSFIAATGCALYIGVFCRDNFLMGTIAGSSPNACIGAGPAEPALGQNVEVPCGTTFGIVLQDAVYSNGFRSAACPAGSGAGPCALVDVCLTCGQPFMSECVLMVPLKPVLDALCVPLVYDKKAGMVAFVTDVGKVVHQVGSSTLLLNGGTKQLSGCSSMINGEIFVPSDAITITTGKRVMWNADNKRMQLQ